MEEAAADGLAINAPYWDRFCACRGYERGGIVHKIASTLRKRGGLRHFNVSVYCEAAAGRFMLLTDLC